MRISVSRVRFTGNDGFRIVSAVRDTGEDAYSGDACPLNDVRDFSVKGPLGDVSDGDVLDVHGDWKRDPKWGWQFTATAALPAVQASDTAFLAWLRKFNQVGPQRARQILKHFGSKEAVGEVLEHEPQRLTEIPGLTHERVAVIADEYTRIAGMRDSIFYVCELGLGARLEQRVLETFKNQLREAIENDPYVLMKVPGVGFYKADDIARKLGISAGDDRRCAAFAAFLVTEATRDGHVWSTLDELTELT